MSNILKAILPNIGVLAVPVEMAEVAAFQEEMAVMVVVSLTTVVAAKMTVAVTRMVAVKMAASSFPEATSPYLQHPSYHSP